MPQNPEFLRRFTPVLEQMLYDTQTLAKFQSLEKVAKFLVNFLIIFT